MQSHRRMYFNLFLTLVCAWSVTLTTSALARPYPNKPVRVIVTFPPGGTPDIYGRILAQELTTLWKQSVVVENKAGASGAIRSTSRLIDAACGPARRAKAMNYTGRPSPSLPTLFS